MSAEWGWLSRCGDTERPSRLSPDDFPTVESLTETWSKVETYVRAFLSTLKDEDLGRSVEFTLGGDKRRSMLLGELLRHGAIHAVHHRGQVALLLRLIDYSPGNFDMLFFFGERHETGGG